MPTYHVSICFETTVTHAIEAEDAEEAEEFAQERIHNAGMDMSHLKAGAVDVYEHEPEVLEGSAEEVPTPNPPPLTQDNTKDGLHLTVTPSGQVSLWDNADIVGEDGSYLWLQLTPTQREAIVSLAREGMK
jgi:hypothetical protein